MLRLGESVRGGGGRSPAFDRVGLDLDRRTAIATDQVVMVAGRRTRPIEAFSLGGLEGVGVALIREIGERSIHGCEPDRRPAVTEPRVQILSADEAGVRIERVADGLPLPGIAFHAPIVGA